MNISKGAVELCAFRWQNPRQNLAGAKAERGFFRSCERRGAGSERI